MNENELDELYFKDAFDLNDDSLSLTINKLKVDCISSNENNFSLDSEGNLLVNTIQTKTGSSNQMDFDDILELIYPVGSIYFSINNINPSTLFKGTWISWGNGRVPVGIDTSQSEFNTIEKTGGNKFLQAHSHTGNTTSAGAHGHGVYRTPAGSGVWGFNPTGLNRGSSIDYGLLVGYSDVAGDHWHNLSTNNTGLGNSENLQPYITCYMWKRTA